MTDNQLLFELRRQLAVATTSYVCAVGDARDAAHEIRSNVSAEQLKDWKEKCERESKYGVLYNRALAKFKEAVKSLRHG